MSEMMRNPPIFYTAAQVRFNPVLDMEDSISHVQKVWRQRFPDFSHQPLSQIQMQVPSAGEAPSVKVNSIARWHFKNIDQTSALILANDSLIFHTTQYSTSVDFIDTLVDALKVVDEVVSLSYVEAVGFRTLDAVIPTAGKGVDFYLRSGLLGLSASLDGILKHSVYEMVMLHSHAQLASRCIMLNGKLGVPADLYPIMLKFKDEVNMIDGPHAVLDNDATQLERFAFNIEDVAKRLRMVKSLISDAFYQSVTSEALLEWNNSDHVHAD